MISYCIEDAENPGYTCDSGKGIIDLRPLAAINGSARCVTIRVKMLLSMSACQKYSQ